LALVLHEYTLAIMEFRNSWNSVKPISPDVIEGVRMLLGEEGGPSSSI
jgi:hypothetical protein